MTATIGSPPDGIADRPQVRNADSHDEQLHHGSAVADEEHKADGHDGQPPYGSRQP